MPLEESLICRTLVLLDSLTAKHHAPKITALREAGYHVLDIEYKNLQDHIGRIRAITQQNRIEFLLFSRNDQVFDRVSIGAVIKALKTGYSSFSGIDDADVVMQTGICLEDLCCPGRNLTLRAQPVPREFCEPAAGSVSFVFDLEQLGGARFGLPRILDLLATHRIRATFFVTNFVQAVYPDVIETLVHCGHEIGLHGECHEYLAGHPLDKQSQMIRRMKDGFARHAVVRGANFIGRMDETSPAALAGNEIEYFVHFLEHRYTPFRYQSLPLRPLPYWSAAGTVWMVPLSVETNNRPWFTVKNTIDSAVQNGIQSGFRHINILMHPFRDGALRHLKGLDRMIRYLVEALRHQPVTVGEMVRTLPRSCPDAFVYFPLQAGRGEAEIRTTATGWAKENHYCARAFSVYQALVLSGFDPALCGTPPRDRPVLWVHPYPTRSSDTEAIRADPLQFTAQELAEKYLGDISGGEALVRGFIPSGFTTDVLNAVRYSKPQSWRDCAAVLPEVALRLAYRASAGRHIF
jgi:peptidoglycan/xylan/chitin deacetylase (PgdA/CDA1 family)